MAEGIRAVITITATQEGQGLLLSLKSDGDFSDEMIDRRFYSLPGLPPDGLESRIFWGPLLTDIGRFLGHPE